MVKEYCPDLASEGHLIQRGLQHVCRSCCYCGDTMNKDPNIEAFYTSRRWRQCRAAFIRERGGLCERCMGRGLITPATQVHHRIPLTTDNLGDPAVALSFDNLMALCDECHNEQHHTKRWRCGPDGQIEIRR